MEKTVSAEERVRRAEEIYYRRKLNNNDVRMPSSQVKDGNNTRKFSLYRKMIIQILICVLIYLVFSLIKEANYLFSEEVINKTKEFLSSDINFQVISNQIGQFFKDNQDKINIFTDEQNINEQVDSQGDTESDNLESNQENNNIENTNTENSNTEDINQEQQNIEDNQQENQISNENVGIGGATTNEVTVATSADESAEKTQMEIDAEYIKQNFTMVLPANAVITSHYGKREATEIVSENHQGIDIGVVEGTKIVAAMEGTVSVVSDEGEYGTHVKIENEDVVTIYAHCSKILVEEGEKVKTGQEIALSGNTGKTTGPHLHFEIRRSGRSVDPELILDWG